MLQIRLEELGDAVDHFVVVEASQTFQQIPPTPQVDAKAIKDPMVNTNVMQTGLTPTEQALLSPEEQQIRLRQRGLA